MKCTVPFLLCLAFLSGCATYPLGMTADEWESLSPEKRAEMRAEQARIDAADRARREENDRRLMAQMQAEEERRQAELAERRASAVYGDIVVVTLQGGTFEWRDRRYPLQPQAFELIRGERKMLELVGIRSGEAAGSRFTTQWPVSFSDDGNSIVLNDSRYGESVVLVNTGAWDRGETVSLGGQAGGRIEDLSLVGMSATVRYKPGPGMPTRIILERQ